ncbi:MAG: DUF6288 domain-containing protein [Planctomycetota bacterium]
MVPLLVLLLVPDLSAQRKKKKQQDLRWPYGVAKNAGPRQWRKPDLFNMGVIGAKGWDADRKEPDLSNQGGGRRRFGSSRKTGTDKGPKRLVIKALFPRGPAHKAGLRLGDLVVGVDQQRFTKGYREPLAQALLRAESAPRGNTLFLMVERKGKDGATENLDLKVVIPKGGPEAADPTIGKTRDRVLQQALKWLAVHQNSMGGFPQTTSGQNGAVVWTSLAGLAWIAGGSRLKGGKHAQNLRQAYEFVTKYLYSKSPLAGMRPGGNNWDQTTWAFGHAGIFLGELHATKKSKKVQKELQKIVDELARRQEVSGGYAHGPGGPNALGYLELNIMSGFVLTSFGLARQAGCTVDQKVVDKLIDYLEKSAGQGGGVGYAASRGQAAMGNIGRTAGAWLGALSLGLREREFCKSMQSYTRENIANVLGGHATLMQHILLAGVAARALGEGATEAYWKVLRRDLILARAPDGSFQPRPWHESLNMSHNTDVGAGQPWTTACWAIVLGADAQKGKKGGLPAWLGTKLEQ